jgi:hypothetical protein
MRENSYEALIQKLDGFIRKFYKNRMIRGLIYSVALVSVFFLLVTTLEYLGQFDTTGRTLLFWGFILASAFIAGRFFIAPLFKILHFGKLISHDQAAVIIGKHFPDVQDKLLNTLQLKEMALAQPNTLLDAAISQRLQELKPIPFSSAVDFKENRKYIKYVVPPLAIIVVLLFAAPSILTESTHRLVRHSEVIERIAPYQITLVSNALSVAENENFLLEVDLSGDVVPDKLYLLINGQQFKMKKNENGHLEHLFRNVQKSTPFSFYGDGFESRKYTLETLPTPGLLNFNLGLDYPAYTGLKDEMIENTGDITVPAGTKANWEFFTRNTEHFEVAFQDSSISLDPVAKDEYVYSQTLMRNDAYVVRVKNSFLQGKDAIEYKIRVIPDSYPLIATTEERDSLTDKHLYFTGEIKDDYGFRKLVFHYFTESSDGSKSGQGEPKAINVPLSADQNQQQFFYHWNLLELNLAPGDQLGYYFEIWDNDGVNGSKSTRTQIQTYNAPTLDELKEDRDEKNETIKDDLEQSLKDAKDFKKELEELRKDLLQKEEMSWQDRKKIEELLKKHETLEKSVENAQKENKNKDQKQSEFSPQKESLIEKQQQLQELMEEMMTDEMREMMDELERLMEELNMEDIQEQVEKMDFSAEDLEKELERALEQFKQLEWETKMEEALDELQKLAEEQEKLSEESTKEDTDSQELKEKQDELEKKFEDWEKEMDKIEELNKDLEDPNAMPDNKEEGEKVKEDMKESSDQLEKDKKKKASDAQKSASEQMKQMAQQMEMMMQQQEAESLEEDMEALRALLENIITLSFDQEELMEDLKVIDKNNPKYIRYAQTQRKLKDDAKMVEDSLFALSKRIIQLQAPVNREIALVNENMKSALDEMGERKTPEVTKHQQYVMTSFNNLALLLDEALKQMQKESSCNKPGTGNCEKPGGMGSKPSTGDMKKMQEALSKQLEEMKKKMEGFNEGKNNAGKSEMSKELAQMAAKQAAIRREIEKMGQKLNEDGSGMGNEMKKIAKEMEDLEKDLVNKKINQETLERQKDILTRLLKAENAERTREMDEQRKSTEAKEQQISNPIKYSEYQEKKKREIEMLRTMPPALKPYYRDRVNNYFNKLGD